MRYNVFLAPGGGWRIMVMGDLNGCVSDRFLAGVIEKFEVSERNENGVGNAMLARGLASIANTNFQHKDVHKYTR